ncbi:MAG: cytochrome c family protein [Acidobacteria bacterium]|nr:cytochrome c family protein [Acidobacteriota bacterium]
MRSPRIFLGVVATIISATLAVQASAGDHAYIGAKKCKMCHLKEYNSWAATKMANAFGQLKQGAATEAKQKAGLDPNKDYTTDAKCLGCHTTGYGKPGGFVDFATTPDLAGVGCEMCHGAGGTYTQKQYMSLENKEFKKADLVAVGLTSQITKSTCEGCHNTNSPFVGKDYVFDFEARKTQGTHEKIALKYQH